MALRVTQRISDQQQCPLCFDWLAGELSFTCDGCQTLYHLECARELGGCATLGCSHAGVGPDGAASLLTLQRHLQRVLNQAPSAPIGGGAEGERLRAEVIREAVLHERAKALAAEAVRRKHQRARQRREAAGTIVGQLSLAVVIGGAIAALYVLFRLLG